MKEVISDRKLAIFDGGGDFEYFYADIVSFTDYYCFGMVMPNRNGNSSAYRYGAANGQEKVDEISGEGNHYTAKYWEYDSRLGRRWNVDPVVKYHESPYACFANNPIWFIDPNGADSTMVNGVAMWNTQAGDSYWSISEKTGVSVDNLKKWNKYETKAIPKNVNLNLSDPNTTVALGEGIGAYVVGEYGPVYNYSTHLGELFGPPIVMNFVPENEDFDANSIQTVQTVHTNVDWEHYDAASSWFSIQNLNLVETYFIDGTNANGTTNIFPNPHSPRFYGSSIQAKLPNFGDNPGIPSNSQGTSYFYAETSILIQTSDNIYKRVGTFTWGYEVKSDGSVTLTPIKVVTTPSSYHLQAIDLLND